MAKMKTVETDASVTNFLGSVKDESRRKDAMTVLSMMQRITGEKPKMWGSSIVGFGRYHYKYDSGREGDYLITGFSPRKTALTIYIMSGFEDYGPLLSKLGKYKTGKSCLYINRLEDIDQSVLETLVKKSFAAMKKKYGAA